ncbi:class I SAM-dependent methyltransferase [Phyllobacterium sp. YR531]|uniref:class I SAM-dependent methyltransferase n=1 Tax=Phyllobacterium sp. YR531 TaxID=1144343 RepID=UPI00026FCBF6|nr:class I SAM-dependent methyltransferase [Phyllobacterium sp. YR531]EJN04903.1 methylase involved in ubiquinone/menaquinone biosynthesis [Phyllobacterium sp. YR531]
MLDRADFYDAELKRYNEHLRAASNVRMDDQVLDIGCGAGQSTRDAARIAVKGRAIGIDTSTEMLEVARQRSDEVGLRNIVFEQGDAQSHSFSTTNFDLCLSRFGVMFFADPAAAFGNIARAMRPAGRIVWMVWQSQDHNKWSASIRRILAPQSTISEGVVPAFSLGDPIVAKKLLNSAGFVSVDFTDVREPVFYGADVDSAFNALVDLYPDWASKASDDTVQRLRDLLEEHMTNDGVLFDSRAWIITAHKGYSITSA